MTEPSDLERQWSDAWRSLAEGLRDEPAPSDGFSTAAFVRRLARSDAPLAAEETRQLDRLCKKVDVARRLAATYTADLSRAVGEAVADALCAVVLCGLYLREARRQTNLKFLNTALKMLDGTLRQPKVEYPAFLRQWAVAVADAWPWPTRGPVPTAAARPLSLEGRGWPAKPWRSRPGEGEGEGEGTRTTSGLVGRLRQALAVKFVRDTFWVGVANVVAGVFGFLLNMTLVACFGEAGFGQFVLAFSVYLVLNMIGVLGINNSVTKHVAERSDDESHVRGVLSAGLLLAAAASLVVALAGWAAAPLVERVYSTDVAAVYAVLLVGLPGWAVNKVLAGHLNGVRDMKGYAFAQAARFVLVVAAILVIRRYSDSLAHAAWAVPATEALLLAVLVVRTQLWRWFRLSAAGPWFGRHLRFGVLSSLNDMLVELYFRVDILIAGYLVSERLCGLYAFAADVTKNLTAFSVLVQVNFNPIISRLWAVGDVPALRTYIARLRRTTYLMYVPITVAAAVGYPLFLLLWRSDMLVAEHLAAYYLLLAGVFVFSGYSALLGVLAYTGHVGLQLRRSFYTLALNAVLSLTLIPLLGIMGAALSVVASFLLAAGYTRQFINTRVSPRP